jgi:Flp pilus assembly protein TadD
MHVAAVLLSATRMMDFHQWENAYQLLTTALSHKDDYMKLYLWEVKNLMTQVCIITGRDDEARQHYTEDIAKYVTQHASTQSDKQLTGMAVALALEGDRPKAESLLHKLENDRDKFIHQGDVAMSLDLMHWLLDHRQAQ